MPNMILGLDNPNYKLFRAPYAIMFSLATCSPGHSGPGGVFGHEGTVHENWRGLPFGVFSYRQE